MNGDSEKFDVKMVVLKYVRHDSIPSRFEFIADDHDQTLADLVVPSLRIDFKITEDKHFVLESKDGQMQLFKILKSLKLYNWRLLTSNAFAVPGSNSSVETVFYYEKSLSAAQPAAAPAPVASVVSKYSYNLKRAPAANETVQNHHSTESSSGKTGIEEEKSAGSYTQKPTPSVLNRYIPTPASNTHSTTTNNTSNSSHTNTHSATHSEESAGQTEADYSLKRVSTNREKLLQKYNQHRRLSLGKSADQTEAPPSPTRAATVNKPVFGSTNAGNSASFSGTSSASAAVSANNGTSGVGGVGAVSSAVSSAHVAHVNTNTTFASTPPPTPLTTSTTAATFSPTHATHAVPSSTSTNTNNSTANNSTTASTNNTTTSTLHASDAPKPSAAGAYPSLVRRVSAAKGFVQVSSTTTAGTAGAGGAGGAGSSGASSGAGGSVVNGISNVSSASGGDVTPKSMSRVPSSSGLDSHSHSNSFTHNNHTNNATHPATTHSAHANNTSISEEPAPRPASFSLKHTTPAPPTAPLPASIATAAAAAHTNTTPITSTSSSGSNNVPVVSAPEKAVTTTSAPTLSVTQPSSTTAAPATTAEEESQDEPVMRISSLNPLTAPSRAVQQSITPPTPEADQHEVSRTNHYSKLGSAFFSGNALGPGARRSGGRGSGYLNSLNK